ncbi:uncharacterized protein LOC128040535 [Gossypium raimondii]|uniref:uncharacterized protein LOC128040535 n=1 Tax=Gossypium raimondii TaxID=29730 RepID=UPI00227A1BE5|nr:uncharacterized protein LOC128040535 [Gossypium raimondii]
MHKTSNYLSTDICFAGKSCTGASLGILPIKGVSTMYILRHYSWRMLLGAIICIHGQQAFSHQEDIKQELHPPAEQARPKPNADLRRALAGEFLVSRRVDGVQAEKRN